MGYANPNYKVLHGSIDAVAEMPYWLVELFRNKKTNAPKSTTSMKRKTVLALELNENTLSNSPSNKRKKITRDDLSQLISFKMGEFW